MHISRLEIQFLSSFGHFFCLVHAFFAGDSESFSTACPETCPAMAPTIPAPIYIRKFIKKAKSRIHLHNHTQTRYSVTDWLQTRFKTPIFISAN